MKQRILNILIALDQLAYVIVTIGEGHPDETLSAAAWRLEKSGKPWGCITRPLIDALFWFDKNHCENSYTAELKRSQLPKEYR